MNLFDLKNGVVVISPEGLLIPEFKALWDEDKTKDKEKALQQLSYVYFISDYKSPYVASYDAHLLLSVVARDFMKDESYDPNHMVLAAIDKYKKLQDTPSMKLLIAAVKTVNNLSTYLEHIDLQERDNAGRPVYKPNDVSTSLSKIGSIVESLKKVREQVERETVQIGQLRGQRKKGNREDPR